MPVLVMMNENQFKMLSEEPRDRVVMGTMADYDRALAEGLITPFRTPGSGGAPAPRPTQAAPSASGYSSAPSVLRQAVSYQPAPSRGSAGMQAVGAGLPSAPRQPSQMKGAADFAVATGNPTVRSETDQQLAAWNGPAAYQAPAPVVEGQPLFQVGSKINPVTGLPYQRADLPQPAASYSSMTPVQPMPEYRYLDLPQGLPEPLTQQWNNQNIPGLAEWYGPNSIPLEIPPYTPAQPVTAYGAYAPNTEGTSPLFYTPPGVNPVTGLPYQREDLWR